MKDIEEISSRLKIAKKKVTDSDEKDNKTRNFNVGMAFKISTELIAAVLLGSFIGFILDTWFDTKPILIIIFFFIGVAAGILNVIRSAKSMQKNKENI